MLAWSSKPEQQRGWEAAGVSGPAAPGLAAPGASRTGPATSWTSSCRSRPRLEHRPVRGRQRGHGRHPHREPDPDRGPERATSRARTRSRTSWRGSTGGSCRSTSPGSPGTISLEGGTKIVAAGPDGPTRVIGHRDAAAPGREEGLRPASSRLPEGYEHVTIEPSARYPAVTWTAGGQTWQDNSARTITLVAAGPADAHVTVGGRRAAGSGAATCCDMGRNAPCRPRSPDYTA